jgi:hypothetical protein
VFECIKTARAPHIGVASSAMLDAATFKHLEPS